MIPFDLNKWLVYPEDLQSFCVLYKWTEEYECFKSFLVLIDFIPLCLSKAFVFCILLIVKLLRIPKSFSDFSVADFRLSTRSINLVYTFMCSLVINFGKLKISLAKYQYWCT